MTAVPTSERVSCPCFGEIPQHITKPCDRFMPCTDLEAGDPTDCEDCGHKVECHD